MADESMMFICNGPCGQMASTPRGWLILEDTRGGTITDPTSARFRFCSYRCLREWSATYVPLEEPSPSKRGRIRGPSRLIGASLDE